MAERSLRFDQGESITIEAWVSVEELKKGQYAYIIGKGRSGKKGFAEKNQNYAMRLKGETRGPRLSFLFASREEAKKPGEWHRWTSIEGFQPGAEWHHVAVSYTFGKPQSIRGCIDGREVAGTWDMGGPTTRSPVVDADDVVVGSGNGNGPANRLNGSLDELAVYRGAVPMEVLQSRWDYDPPPAAVEVTDVPAKRVLVQLCEEGMPAGNAWPTTPPRATESYTEDVFGFVDMPQKYVDTGIRGDRGNPLLLRAAAKVTLPKGTHRILLRARNASRLFIDDKELLTTKFQSGDGGGHGKVKHLDEYLNLGPDFRFAPCGEGEAWTSFASSGGEHFVVMETIVGGAVGKSKRRPELGETVVAISTEGQESWELLSPSDRRVAYTDDGWMAFAAERRERLAGMNAEARAAKRAEHAAYWDRRRTAAQDWLSHASPIAVPTLPQGYPANNAIDHFLGERLESAAKFAAEAPKDGVDFHCDVQPILEAKCQSCHKGVRAQGGLRLDSLASVLKGGESYGAAIVPGKPEDSPLLTRARSTDPDEVMPPKGEHLTDEQTTIIDRWIAEGARWPEFKLDRLETTPLADDLTFLRCATLDIVGVVPTLEEIEAFQSQPAETSRAQAIDRLLADPRWADHWVSYWQDVLAENPNILNPTLNNTGPFRWWIYESLLDDVPFDAFVTDLVRMRGSERFGGPAGFAVASQNDAPLAAKGTVVSSAFLGVQMKCARCHDAPAHSSTQEELFGLAAMLAKQPVEVPKTSSVALDKLTAGGRTPLIQVTLKPGTKVDPKWPFAALCDESAVALAEDAEDPRDRLAALMTAPQNERFAQVIVNRLWQRFMGVGLVEPVDDWEQAKPSHPELLAWLAREFVRGGYQMKPIVRLIVSSHAYQRATDPQLRAPSRLFAAPAPRRLSAEQIVDSLFVATGKPMRVEEISLDVDGRRDLKNSISLGQPSRAWMFASTSNERDRPSLALPRAQAVVDVLQAFGWRGSRQDATTVRETAPNALQGAILANGTASIWLTRLSDDHGITRLALEEQTIGELLDAMFLRLLTRLPTDEERARYSDYLREGFETRLVANPRPATPSPRVPQPYVSWSNHLDPAANVLKQQEETMARHGDPPTSRLEPGWRSRMEDVLWALLNSTEFVFTP